jgi:hypothetical protein
MKGGATQRVKAELAELEARILDAGSLCIFPWRSTRKIRKKSLSGRV